MQDSGEETLTNNEVTSKEQPNVEEEFFEDGNVDFEGEFEEGSEIRFSPGGGFRYVYLRNTFHLIISTDQYISHNS